MTLHLPVNQLVRGVTAPIFKLLAGTVAPDAKEDAPAHANVGQPACTHGHGVLMSSPGPTLSVCKLFAAPDGSLRFFQHTCRQTWGIIINHYKYEDSKQGLRADWNV